MTQGDWLRATLSEAWSTFTPLLVVGFLVAAAVRSRASRAQRSRASMRGTALFLLLHLVTVPLVGWLAAHGSASTATWRLVSVTLATVAGVTIALAILFDGVLRWVRVQVPRIAQDVGAAGAYLVAGFVLLSAWGFNLGGLIATSAVLTAVIGFSLQDTLGNLMAGMALQAEKSIRPGDWIEVNDQVGRVLEVRWRQTTVETRDWETVIVPNSYLAKNQFKILGRRRGEPLQLRRWVHFQVDYRTPPSDVIRTAEEALRRAPIPAVSVEPAPDCILLDMRNSFHSYAVRYFLTDLQRDDPVDGLVRTRLATALQRAGIPLTMPAQALFVTSESEERRQRKERMRDQDQVAVLRRAELFRDLSGDELQELADGLRFSPFSAGEVMTRQGGVGHDLYFIHSGEVAVRVAAGSTESEVSRLGPGTFFGERSLMTGEPRSATTVALTDVVCYRLAKRDLEAVLKRRPELAEQMAEVLAVRESEIDERRQSLSSRARTNRVADDTRQFVTKIRDFFGL